MDSVRQGEEEEAKGRSLFMGSIQREIERVSQLLAWTLGMPQMMRHLSSVFEIVFEGARWG